ncbi:3-phenylpropionate/trans-cinnamate dioxygenase ferredoxin reductase subunit/ferredoxin [Nocardioides sp. J9]|uniref:ferredoxin n=1 Tax=unclassified Nocardioides TaxID=2615069 RepID=UPI000490EAD0|nr:MULTISPECIES: ferredoxin [unclassified Nocardioides]TWH00882.1 3-phenylpropionate/trans-cinnamate dioxygenase ferredoxin reductase subunit/ferredoxin [Nocardioides sp. J9]
MKVVHTQGTCGGVEECLAIAPDYFVVDDDGLLQVARADIDGDDLERVTEAVNACPTGALRLEKILEGRHA